MLTHAEMYGAIVRRDASLIGALFVGVKTTGIFCRPGCPARAPNPENCEFFATAAAALRAGYRPCKRCAPLAPPEGAPAWAMTLMDAMADDPSRVLTADDARRVGVHPATASRFFKAWFGDTFQGLSRARRVGLALTWMREGRPAGRAAGDAGFESESGFRKAVHDLFGTTPGRAADGGLAPLGARWFTTPLGAMLAVASEAGVCLLEYTDRRMLVTNLGAIRLGQGRPIVPGDNEILRGLRKELEAYHHGQLRVFRTPLNTAGTPFQERVWGELREIGYGRTRSYAGVARAIGRPTAVRAVARANGDNRIAILIPCHRVIGSDGALTGYGGGLHRKRRLLEIESGTDGSTLFQQTEASMLTKRWPEQLRRRTPCPASRGAALGPVHRAAPGAGS